MKRFLTPVLGALVLAACQGDPTAPTVTTDRALTPAVPSLSVAARGQAIPGRYIVILQRGAVPNVAAAAASIAASQHGRLGSVFTDVFEGFVVDVDDSSAVQIGRDRNVLAVVPDMAVGIDASGVQAGATWGLDRIDQAALPLTTSYAYATDGTGVTVYIVDTGINYAHTDFGGRAKAGYDAVTSGGTAADCNGHGTHVAGTVGGTKYGVAKAVSLVGVRVLDCTGSGSSSGVIAGLDWVVKQKQANPTRPMVVNMSLGGGISTALDNAVTSLTSAGITVVVAAGNSAADACTESPAHVPAAITVGATNKLDGFASFSNYGTCVDLNAPGVSITSDYYTSTTATAAMSGTSMASPHVAGAAALYLSKYPTATPAQVSSALTTNATPNKITTLGAGTPNKLLYVGFLGAVVSANAAPTATITAPAAGASVTQGTSVTFTGTGTDPEDGALSGASLVWTSSINGQIGTGTSFSTTTLSAGTHTITLKATDSKGASATATRSITVVAPAPPPPSSTAPVASFTWNCTGMLYPHQCAFDASTSTAGAAIASYTWNWGNGRTETKTAATTKNTWAATGTYTVTLTVKDANGLTGTVSKQVPIP
ncbi:peptidase S8 and S53 subtilisin kexin sedolisin [Gemmatirosa kalamazoonensis]|uniref:Peptidase S8 and S53 subtilisin kexin sedolisin n=1 Tax=Gemmatirosa kalamazoonensis TaxID=861299 RepID=W0RLN2_9BACT|nr:S8 family serine peptidase [Gemmatirosa kalamazoonensis]AHG91357.1 peptidase S8 and S53 subtilisin kexin sedolisin [Gemmatirosa kalamazoonensis]